MIGKTNCKISEVTSNGLKTEPVKNDSRNSRVNGDENEGSSMPSENEKLFDILHKIKSEDYETLKRYPGIWKSVIDKYPDNAHFIYELLQNADDALAEDVTIILRSDSVIFKHNGSIHFTISDESNKDTPKGHINSLTGIGNSTKIDNDPTNKIGKFGIGFKSVFQYTDAPEVYDDDFKFRITNYIVPERLKNDKEERRPGETLFYLPFKNPIGGDSARYNEISDKLSKLDNATLFLNCVKRINWCNEVKNESGLFTKEIKETLELSQNILLQKISFSTKTGEKQDLLMFSRNINLGEDGVHKINVGYYLKNDGSIDTDVNPGVYCFFPTSESFRLCMLVHAPFLLVDNRQQIKQNEPINRTLVNEIAKLTADTLLELRNLGLRENKYLINENIEQIVQWNNYKYCLDTSDALIKPLAIITSCLQKIRENELLISNDKKTYLKGKNSYELKPKPLANLISNDQLQMLLKSRDNSIGVLSADFKEFSPSYCNLGITKYTNKNFAADISSEFMTEQPREWFNKLFNFLNNEATSLCDPDNTKNSVFLTAPIINTESGKWVSPYYKDRLNVFMEGDASKYNIVSSLIMSCEPAMKFLQNIKCQRPTKVDYILRQLLPKYSQNEFTVLELNNDLIYIYMTAIIIS